VTYQPRTYRKQFNRERFYTFSVQYRESNLFIGVDHEAVSQIPEKSGIESLKEDCISGIKDTRELISSYEALHPGFTSTHKPLPLDNNAPPLIREMMACGERSATGPMTSVAGLFARETARKLIDALHPREIMVENGGDFYLRNAEPVFISVYAGNSPLSNKLSIEIPPGEWGVSTSSGTIGHSYSYGKADAVTVICKDPLLSDAWATSLANRIQTENDIEKVLKHTESIPEILSCMIILGDRVGVRGEFKIKPVNNS